MVAKAPYDDLFLDLPGRAQGAVGAGVAETRESALPGGRRVRVDRKVAAAEVLTDLPMTHLPFAAIIAPPGELAAAVAVRTLGRRGPARSSTADDGALRTAVAALPDLFCSADQPSSLDFAEFLIAWAPDRQGIDSLLWSFEYPLAGRASDPTWYTLSGQVDCPVIAPIVDDVYRRGKKIALAPYQDGPVAGANEASSEAGTFRPSGSILSDAYDFLRLQGGSAAAYQRRAVAASRGVVRRGKVGMRLAPSQKIEDALSERAFLKECEGAALLARLTADPWIPLIDGETASAAASRAGRSPEAAAQALGIAVLAARFDPTKPNVERVQALILELDSYRVDRRRGALGQPDDPSSATFDLAPTALAAALRRVDLEPKVAETARDLIESCARYVRDERPLDERGDFALAEGFYATGDRQYLELAHLSIAATAKRGAVRAESPIGLDALLYVLQFNSSLTFWKELPIDAVRQADGRWRIAWTTPLGATGWRLKVADRRIVDSLVFEPRTGVYRHDPATHQPFFAAVSLTGLPNLGPTGTRGEAIVDVPIAGDTVHFQARFRQSDLRKAGGLDPHRGPVAPPQDATRAGGEAPTTAALPSQATTRPKGPLALESMPVEVQRKVRVARQLFWAKVAGAIGTILIFAIVLTRKRRK